MGFILQRQNNLLLIISLVIILAVPLLLEASIYEYNPDIDVSFGNYYLIIHDNGNFIVNGSYMGVLYLMESPLLKNLFSTNRFYSIYNFGITFFNDENNNNNTIIFLPFSINIGYKLQFLKKFELFPFAGWGLGIIPADYSQIKKSALLSINIGFLIRYRLWNTTYLKLRLEYGTIFGNQFPDKGYANYLRIVYPIPFIP